MSDTIPETTRSGDLANLDAPARTVKPGLRRTAALYWPFVIARAVTAAVIAAVITFSADHSVLLGLVLFAIFASATGVVVVAGGVLAIQPPLVRSFSIGHGLIGIASAIAAVIVLAVSPSPATKTLVTILCAYAVITGSLELYSGVRTRRARNAKHAAASRDWIFLGAITAVLSITVLLVPLNLRVPIKGQHGVEGFLTAPVVVVGLFGAYCAMIAVYLVIAGLSLKWTPTTSAAVAAERVT